MGAPLRPRHDFRREKKMGAFISEARRGKEVSERGQFPAALPARFLPQFAQGGFPDGALVDFPVDLSGGKFPQLAADGHAFLADEEIGSIRSARGHDHGGAAVDHQPGNPGGP